MGINSIKWFSISSNWLSQTTDEGASGWTVGAECGNPLFTSDNLFLHGVTINRKVFAWRLALTTRAQFNQRPCYGECGHKQLCKGFLNLWNGPPVWWYVSLEQFPVLPGPRNRDSFAVSYIHTIMHVKWSARTHRSRRCADKVETLTSNLCVVWVWVKCENALTVRVNNFIVTQGKMKIRFLKTKT